jgi:cellulose biosynthesis protein BcsQ
MVESAFEGRSVIVCCGPGGVGKTTAAATIAVHLAMTGKRVAVLTIDPAKRLAMPRSKEKCPLFFVPDAEKQNYRGLKDANLAMQ